MSRNSDTTGRPVSSRWISRSRSGLVIILSTVARVAGSARRALADHPPDVQIGRHRGMLRARPIPRAKAGSNGSIWRYGIGTLFHDHPLYLPPPKTVDRRSSHRPSHAPHHPPPRSAAFAFIGQPVGIYRYTKLVWDRTDFICKQMFPASHVDVWLMAHTNPDA